ncbi:MAG: hypothetical protein AAFX99_08975 [Myxococcota bacterium]
MTGRTLTWLVGVSLLMQLGLPATQAEARSSYPSRIPNGNQFSCGLCHEGGIGGARRNLFGAQFEAMRPRGTPPDWSRLFDLDADGDGFTNGEEMGDPDGDGTPIPGFVASQPSDPDDTPALPECGNGLVEAGERCDGNQLGGASCTDEGFAGGELSCADDCTLDTGACLDQVCGNGIVEGDEACDGNPLSGASCADEGFTGGELRCSESCTLDTEACTTCGDGVIEEGESCDGEALAGQSCEGRGFSGGTLLCGADCVFDVSQCEDAPEPVCGNGLREGDEVCDGDELGAASCAGEGFAGGELSCANDCTLDTGACTTCGDGVLDEDEACDGDELGGLTCLDEGFAGGELACTPGCTLDRSACVEAMPDAGMDNDTGSDTGAEADTSPTGEEDSATAQADVPEEDTSTTPAADDTPSAGDDDGGCSAVQGSPLGHGWWLMAGLLMMVWRRR